jgi:hypothetical protein
VVVLWQRFAKNQIFLDSNRISATSFIPPMNNHSATNSIQDFSIEKISGGCVVSPLGRLAMTWMTRLYETPGGNDF